MIPGAHKQHIPSASYRANAVKDRNIHNLCNRRRGSLIQSGRTSVEPATRYLRQGSLALSTLSYSPPYSAVTRAYQPRLPRRTQTPCVRGTRCRAQITVDVILRSRPIPDNTAHSHIEFFYPHQRIQHSPNHMRTVTFQACAPGTFIPGACHHSSHDWVT
jgi:hypothetical protein